MPIFRRHHVILLTICGTCGFATSGVTAAPVNPALQDSDEAETQSAQSGQGLPIDPRTLLSLKSFQDLLENDSPERAVDEFRRLQTSDPFTMVPLTPDGPTFVPLYRFLFSAFFDLPEAVRRRHIAATPADADSWLAEILESGTPEELPRLIHRAVGTRASLRAHLVLARLHLDRSNTSAARAWLMPLLLDGVPEEFRRTARTIIERMSESDAADTHNLQDPVAAHDPKRKPPTAPEHLHWNFRPNISPRLSNWITAFRDAASMAKVPPQTTWNEVVDSQTVFRRTFRGVAAIDFSTGRIRWQYPLLPSLDSALSNSISRGMESQFGASNAFNLMERTPLADAFCRDSVQGQITADRERLYLTPHENNLTTLAGTPTGNFLTRSSNARFRNNYLVALERGTGRRIWTTGRETLAEELETKSETCWIAGPPAALHDRLFCLFEWSGEMRLGCLDSETGELAWSTLLAFPDQSIDKDPVRQLWQAAPQVRGGLIWCATTTGWSACTDEMTRSVLWATESRGRSSARATFTVGRGRPVAVTPSASLSERWPMAGVFLSNQTLIVRPYDSREILFVDAVAGTPLHEVELSSATVLVHINEQQLIVAELPREDAVGDPNGDEQAVSSPARLRSLNATDGREQWNLELSAADGLPTGRGAVQDGFLLLPMTTGRIAQVSLHNGDLTRTSEPVLPVRGWGHLLSSPGSNTDLLYSAPDGLLLISSQKSPTPPTSPLELAEGFMSSEQWQAALDVLTGMPDADGPSARVDSMKFECHLQMAIRDPESNLTALKSAAHAPEHLVKVKMLESSWLLDRGDPEQAASLLTDLLELSLADLAAVTPPTLFDRPAAALPNAPGRTLASARVQRPLLTWISGKLSEALDLVSDRQPVLSRLKNIPPELLLQLHHPEVREIIQSYLQTAPLNETSFQLLQHSVDLAVNGRSRTKTETAAEAAILANWLQQLSAEADRTTTAYLQARQLLVTAVIQDLPQELRSNLPGNNERSLAALPDRASLDSSYEQGLQSRFRQWTIQPYQTLPVASVTAMNNASVDLSPHTIDDLFLRQYRWSAIRGDYGRLQAQDITATPGGLWSVPGIPDTYSGVFGQNEQLRRVGSLVLIHTFRQLTAVSILDQKVVWTRSFPTVGAVPLSSPRDSGFDNFVPGRDRLPSEQIRSLVKVWGAGPRWICTQFGTKLEITDPLSGMSVWSVELPAGYDRILATDGVIMALGSPGDEALCYDRGNGAPLTLENSEDLVSRAIRGVNEWLICWQAGESGQPSSLQWINPVNGTTLREMALTDMVRFHFLDDSTLVGISDNQEMLVVNLLTGESRACSFFFDVEQPAEATAAQNEAAESTNEKPLWTADRIRIEADGLNYYVSNAVAPDTRPLTTGVQFSAFTGELRAVSRQDGTVQWRLPGDGPLLTVSGYPDLPVLLVIDSKPIAGRAANTPATLNEFRGILKLTGTEVFRQAMPVRNTLRSVQVSSSKPNSLDLSVSGISVRLEGQDNAQPAP